MTTMREVAEIVSRRTGAPYEEVLVAAQAELVAIGYDVPEDGISPDYRFDGAHLDAVVAGVEAQLGVRETRPGPRTDSEPDDL